MYVNTNGKRNEAPLVQEQLQKVKEYAIRLGMPLDRIYYVDYDYTGYGLNFDILRIGTDVFPLAVRVRNPNSNISYKGVIAHEVVGHRDAALKGKTNIDPLLEEVQASIRAARFAPELSKLERNDLIRDAIYRLRNADLYICDVKSNLFIEER
jgi:hypothetical protein